ncbi:hypothetical protein EVAR_46000_1 [Eumeta japonica]|uniref:Histone-lysine N-methyltransferase SETMAR n=1 Tax=Eumeta variegata TaxID=151549 RepID=A0A4C1X9R6_EUMVA|nr:hypothetical protein EVAR_46000_1 [Eumeta japonica]
MSTVRRWYSEFDCGRVSLHDEIREGRPSTAMTEENVATVRKLIEESQRITYEEIRGHLGIERKTAVFCMGFEGYSKSTKLRQARSKKIIAFFFSKTSPVCTILLEKQKTAFVSGFIQMKNVTGSGIEIKSGTESRTGTGSKSKAGPELKLKKRH